MGFSLKKGRANNETVTSRCEGAVNSWKHEADKSSYRVITETRSEKPVSEKGLFGVHR